MQKKKEIAVKKISDSPSLQGLKITLESLKKSGLKSDDPAVKNIVALIENEKKKGGLK